MKIKKDKRKQSFENGLMEYEFAGEDFKNKAWFEMLSSAIVWFVTFVIAFYIIKELIR